MKIRTTPRHLAAVSLRHRDLLEEDVADNLAQEILDEITASLTLLHAVAEVEGLDNALMHSNQIAQVNAVKLEEFT